MANPEHLDILKQGVEVWNAWRAEHPDLTPDLADADLQNATLKGVDLKLCILRGADLKGADFGMRPKGDGTYVRASFSGADLSNADLYLGNLTFAEFIYTNLDRARLNYTILRGADLSYATLQYAAIFNVDFTHAFLIGANLGNASIDSVNFGNTFMSGVVGLDSVTHIGPSFLSIDTLYRHGKDIPEKFLVGCGVPDSLITYLPSLLDAQQAIQFYSCFISYSTKDVEFVKRLHARMRAEHLRVWFAPEDIKGGQKIHEQIDRAIQMHDRLLLILSEESMRSEWVTTEIRRARRTEIEESRRKLFPITIVDFERIKAWKCFDADSGKDLAVEVREYYVPDFSDWKDHDAFETAFARLLRDLKAEESKS